MTIPDKQKSIISPYRGIHPFRYKDKNYYFGREEVVNDLLVKVLMSRLVILYGESGTGKSSLINAGFIPIVEKEGFSPERLRVRPIPQEPISVERIEKDSQDSSPYLQSVFINPISPEENSQSSVIPCSLENFEAVIHQKAPDVRPVLLFDQFEELFTLFDKNGNQEEFDGYQLQDSLLNAIMQIVNNDALKTKVVIIIREDFLGKLEILAKNYPQVFDHRVKLQNLDKIGANRAILGPFENETPFTSRFTDQLSERIVNDMSNDQHHARIQPTQLQIVCLSLWDRFAVTKKEICVDDYIDLGKVEGILQGFLKSKLEHKSSMRFHAFRVLSHLITEASTRDVVSADKLKGLIALEHDISVEELDSTIDFLDKHRLINRTYQRGTNYYEIASEYLIPPVQKEMQHYIVDKKRAEAEKLADEQRKIANQEKKLRIAEEKARTEAEKRAIGEAKAARRSFNLALVLAFFCLLLAVVMVYALFQKRSAELLKNEVQKQYEETIARQLAFDAKYHHSIGNYSERAALLARQAYLIKKDNVQVVDALRTVLSAPHFYHILSGEGSPIQSIAFSPDGQKLAAGRFDSKICLWDLKNSTPELQVLENHENSVISVAFSPNGDMLASAGLDKTVRLWNLKTPDAEPKVFRGHTGYVYSVAFSPDGGTLASAGDDKTIRLWNLDTLDTKTILNNIPSSINSLAFSPDGRTLASGEYDKTVRLWNLETPDAEPKIIERHDGSINFLAFSPDGNILASAGDDGTVMLLNLETFEDQRIPFRDHEGEVISVSFSPDGGTLASAGKDGTIRLHDLTPPYHAPIVLEGHKSSVNSVDFKAPGNIIASASLDGTVRIWDIKSAVTKPAVFKGHEKRINSMVFNPHEKLLASGSLDGTVRLWDLSALGESCSVLKDHIGGVNSVAFSPDGKLMASGGLDGAVRLWRKGASTVLIKKFPGHRLPVQAVAFSPDGKILASAGDDKAVRLWNLGTLSDKAISVKDHDRQFISLSFNPDSNLLAAVSIDETVLLWNPKNPENWQEIHKGNQYQVNSVAFSPDWKLMATAVADEKVRLWKLTGLKIDPVPELLEGHERSVWSVAFSPDGNSLASGSDDKTVRLWDLTGTKPSSVDLKGHKKSVISVAFSSDGNTLFSGSDDGNILVWKTNTEELADIVCQKVWRNLTIEEWRHYVDSKNIFEYRAVCDNLPVEFLADQH